MSKDIPFNMGTAEGAQVVDPDQIGLEDIDPSQANALAQKAMKAAEEPDERAEHPIIDLPPDGSVDLLVGVPVKGEMAFTAVVRELTGEDEEFLAQPANTKTALRYMKAILERALVRLGDHKVSAYTIQDITLADADVIVRAVRQVTFGNEIRLNDLVCPACEYEMDVSYDLTEDVPVKKPLGEKGQQVYEFTTEDGKKVKFRLPTLGDQTKVVDADVSNIAEANTLLLTEIIDSIDNVPITRAADVRNMSMRLRREIVREVDRVNPGLRYQDVEHECSSCGMKFPLVLSTADLFRL